MPSLALFLGYCLVFWLFRRDIKQRKLGSWVLWIPGLWIAILGSRPVAYWMGSGGTNLEGNSLNLLVNGLLILGAFFVIQGRGFDWSQFIFRNKALVLIYAYFVLSALWSEFPVATLKRLTQDFGSVLVCLVLLTERDPAAAVKITFTRIAYVLLPFSVIVIRYFPAIGRISSRSGEQMYNGLTFHKNSLGMVAMVLGLVILWDLLERRETGWRSFLKKDRRTSVGMLVVAVYLLIICNSATAIACATIGTAFLLATRRLARFQNAQQLLLLAMVAVPCLMALDSAFDLSGAVFHILGRQDNLTGRTDIWRVIGEKDLNVLVGAGFRGFWETEEGESVYEELGLNRLLTAHNGYLEAYLNGGLIGLALLGILLLATGMRVIKRLLDGSPFGRIAIVIWIVAAIYNVTETDFFILEPLWFAFLLLTIDYTVKAPKPIEQPIYARAHSVSRLRRPIPTKIYTR